MNSHQNTADSRCGLFDTLPTQTSFVQLWNSISRSGKIPIQFSFHHIWFQSTIDYTQNIQDQDRICIKFNKIKKGPCIFLTEIFTFQLSPVKNIATFKYDFKNDDKNNIFPYTLYIFCFENVKINNHVLRQLLTGCWEASL